MKDFGKEFITAIAKFVLVGVVTVIGVASCMSMSDGPSSTSAPSFSSFELCRTAILVASGEPTTTQVPYVANFGTYDYSGISRHAWGIQSELMTMMVDGTPIPVTGSCYVDNGARRITALTIAGKQII